jgi:hypothetical protein
MTFTILHLEDDDDDSFFFRRALNDLKFQGPYRRVSSVDEAISYFSGTGDFADRNLYPLPRVLVADNKLGTIKTTAHLLSWLKTHEEFGSLMVIVLTGATNTVQVPKELNTAIARILPKGANLEELTLSVREVLKLSSPDPLT